MKLKIELAELESQMMEFVSTYETIEKLSIGTEEELEAGKLKFVETCKLAEVFLEIYIAPVDNGNDLTFKKTAPYFNNIDKGKHSFEMRCKELWNQAKEKKTDLQRIYKITSVSDVMLNTVSEEEILKRKRFTIREKKSLILEKLFELNDGWYYSVKSICIGNNINSTRADEFLGLSKSLEEEGLVEIFRANRDDVLARLSIEGQEFVEEVVSKRLKMGERVLAIKRDLGADSADMNLMEIKASLKELVAKNEFRAVLEKLDLLLVETCGVRNDLIMMMGRFESIESKRRNGLFSDSEYLVFENKVRYDLISVVEGLRLEVMREG